MSKNKDRDNFLEMISELLHESGDTYILASASGKKLFFTVEMR